MKATRRLSLGVVMVGVLIGTGGASEAGFITYSLSGDEAVGTLSQFGAYFPTGAIDPVSLTMTVDTNTIVNDPALSNFSPGYITGSALATITATDVTYGNLSASAMVHASVAQVFASPLGASSSGYFTNIQFIADSGPSLGSVIGQIFIPELVSNPLPVTYDLKSPLGPTGLAGLVSYPFQTSGVTFFIGGHPEGAGGLSPPFSNLEFQATAVPEPSSLALSGIAGLAGLAIAAARRRRPA